jgi:hypothetical protein
MKIWLVVLSADAVMCWWFANSMLMLFWPGQAKYFLWWPHLRETAETPETVVLSRNKDTHNGICVHGSFWNLPF